jgi:FMN-dependent NADH-azoreductase
LTLADFASSEAQAVLGEFLSTDVFIIGAPTDNFGISSQLESWFDHILVPGETFRYTENGVEGPATEKKAIVAVSRGNIYSAVGRTALEEPAESHLCPLLAFVGFSDAEFVIAEGVALGPEQRQAALDGALTRAAQLNLLPLAA